MHEYLSNIAVLAVPFVFISTLKAIEKNKNKTKKRSIKS